MKLKLVCIGVMLLLAPAVFTVGGAPPQGSCNNPCAVVCHAEYEENAAWCIENGGGIECIQAAKCMLGRCLSLGCGCDTPLMLDCP